MKIDAEFAFSRYQAVRARLPQASFPESSRTALNLLQIADQFDAFLFDAFGVLNVGEQAVPGAAHCVAQLQKMGKPTLVVTNAGSFLLQGLQAKYQKLGFNFEIEQVISSRELLFSALSGYPDTMHWGVVALPESGIEQLDFNLALLGEEQSQFDQVDGFLFLGVRDWTQQQQELLINSLKASPRPFLVGNPDIVAPRETRFSLQPGFYAHAIADATTIEPQFFGKPFGHVFKEATDRINQSSPTRVLMIGDTLHTDILGGAAAGLSTALVTDHGLFKGHDVNHYIERSGIIPDFILPTI